MIGTVHIAGARTASRPAPRRVARARQDGTPAADRSGGLILVVDDESGVREVMSRWLRANGYLVVAVSSADEALAVAAADTPAVALCDVRMPGRDGLWLASRLRGEYPETAVIMITGAHDVDAALAGLRHGVLDYLTKPFGHDRLRDAVARALEWHRAARDLRHWRTRLEGDADTRRARLSRLVNVRPIESETGVEALVHRLARVYPEVTAHAGRVASRAEEIACALAVGSAERTAIRHGALLHEIGRLALPEAILQKPAPLSADEEVFVHRHPAVGAEILAVHPFLAPAAAIVRTLRERPDGRGYPAVLAGDAVPLASRIVAVADAFDTMTHARIFRGAMRAADALAELERCSGTQFDRDVVAALARLVRA